MKKVLYTCISVIAVLLFSTACDREKLEWGNGGTSTEELNKGTGVLSFAQLKLAVNDEIATSRAEGESVNTDNFMVKVCKGEEVIKSWLYKDMPEVFSVEAGEYVVTAQSHDEQLASWDTPYYYGEEPFVIEKDKITEVQTLECHFLSIKVQVSYDAQLWEFLGDDVKVVVGIKDNEQTLEFAKNESRLAYFHAPLAEGNIIQVTLTGTVENQQVNVTREFVGVKAGEFRNVEFFLKTIDESLDYTGGFPYITPAIDSNCNLVTESGILKPEQDPVIEDFPEEGPVNPDPENPDPENPDPENPDTETPPYFVGIDYNGSGFDIDDTLLVGVEDGETLKLSINAPNGLTHVYVKIDSEKLTGELLNDVGLSGEFDLATGLSVENNDLSEPLQGLGFPVGADVIGKQSIDFDISQFLPLLGIYGAAVHQFIITAEDAEGFETTATLKLETL